MTVDIATLGLEIKTIGVDEADQKLNKLTATAGKTERASDSFKASLVGVTGASHQLIASIERAVQEMLQIQRAQQSVTAAIGQGASAALAEARAMGQLAESERAAYSQSIQLARSQRDVAVASQAAAVASRAQSVAAGAQAAASGVARSALSGLVGGLTAGVATLGAAGLAAAAASAALGYLAEKADEGAKRTKELTDEAKELHAALDESYPYFNKAAIATDLAAEGQKNFESYLRKSNAAIWENADALKAATVASFAKQAADAQQKAEELRRLNTSPGRNGVRYSGGWGGLGMFGRDEWVKAQAELDTAAAHAKAQLAEAQRTGAEHFAKEEKAAKSATSAVRGHSRAIEDQVRVVDALTAAANALKGQGALAGLQALASFRDRPDLSAGEKAFDRAQEDAARRAADIADLEERNARERLQIARDLARSNTERLQATDAIVQHENQIALKTGGIVRPLASKQDRVLAAFDDVAGNMWRASRAVEQGDWAGAVGGVFQAFSNLRKALSKTASAAERAGAIAGIADMAGQAIGGVAGSTISGAAQGFAYGGPVGAVIGGIMGFVNGNKEKEAEKERRRQAEAQRQAQITTQRQQLEIELLRAQGDELGATNMQRRLELASMDASNRALAERLYALQDEQLATEKAAEAAQKLTEALKPYSDELAAATSRVNDARQNLTATYQREQSAIQSTRDKFLSLADSLAGLRANIASTTTGGGYSASRSAFLAAANDNDGSAIQATAQRFLEVAKSNATSSLAYQRDVAMVQRRLAEAEAAARNEVSIADQQLAALDAQVAGLGIVNSSVLSVRDAVVALQMATAQQQAAQTVLQGRPGYQDWASYGAHYKDVAAEWERISSDPVRRQWWSSAEDFYKWHYNALGKDEGRTPYALGGYVSGPGTGTSDSIAAWLSDGEFVSTAEATALYRPELEAMNRGTFRPANDGDELAQLRAEVAALRREGGANEARMIALLSKIETLLVMVTEGGDAMRVVDVSDEAA